MSENGNQKNVQFLKKILQKITPRFSVHYVVYTILLFVVVFSAVQIVTATTPNPGHPWTEVGDGLIQFAAPTGLRTYTGPDANATLLTTNAVVTVAQGGIGVGTLASNGVLYGNGTGAVQALAVNAGAAQCLTQASSAAPAWGSCGSSTWDTIGDAAGDGTIEFASTEQIMNFTDFSDTDFDGFTYNFDNNGGTAGTDNGIVLNNAVSTNSSGDVATENILLIQQLDTTASGTTGVDNGIKIDSAANSGITDGIEVTNSAGNITNGLNLVDTAGGTFTSGIVFSGTFTNAIDAAGTLISLSELQALDGGIDLTTETNGNYVASATSNGGLALTGTEGGSLGILLPAATDALSSTTSSGSGMELLSGGLALLQGCSDTQILKWTESSDTWGCAADANSGGSTAWDAIGDPSTGADIAFGTTAQTMTWTASTQTGLNIINNSLTTGQGLLLSHTTSVIADGGSILRATSSSVDTGGTTNGTLLDLSASGTVAGTLMKVRSTAASQTSTRLLDVVASGYTTGYTGSVANFTGVSTTGNANVVNITSANTTDGRALNISSGVTTTNGTAVNITANSLTTGTALIIPHTTSVIASGGSLLRLSSTSADTATTTGTLLDLSGVGTTSGTLQRVASSTLTTGKLLDLQVSGTAAAASQTALNILTTGANGTAGITTYGAQIANTHSTNTSTNIGLYATASGGATANYSAIFDAGNVGIGNTTPSYKLDVINSTTGQTASNRVINSSTAGATFNTTSGDMFSYAGYFSSTSTRSGANNLFNVGLYSVASGGDDNYAAILDGKTILGDGSGFTNYALFAANGSLQFGGTASYLIPDNTYIFRLVADNDIGLYLNQGNANLEVTDTAAVTVFGVNVDSGDTTIYNQGDIRLSEDKAIGSNYVAFQAPSSIASNVTWTLPNADASGCFQSNGSGTVSIASCGGGGTWDTIGDAAGNGAIAMGATVQTMDWATANTQAAMTFNANALTTGELLTLAHTTSVIASGGSLLRLSSTSADTATTTGTLLDLSSTAATSGTLALITNNTASYTGKTASISMTGATTGKALDITLGSTLTTGGAINISGASYAHGTETGSVNSIAFTDATTAAVTSTTNGVLVTPTISAASGAATRTINGLSVEPAFTNCAAGTCAVNGVNIASVTDGTGFTGSAFKIGTGWDQDILFRTDATHTFKVEDQDTAATAGSTLAVTGANGNTSGNGGDLTFTSGNGGGTGATNAGTITVNNGTVSGAGTATLNIGSSNTTALNLGNSATTVVLNSGTPATNGIAYSTDANGTIAYTATGGAGTLCLVSVAGGTPTFSSCAGSTSTSWSALSAPSGNLSLAHATNTTTMNWALTGQTGFTIGETTAATGASVLSQITTLSTSTAKPLQITSGGTADINFNLASTGDFTIQDNGTIALTLNDSGNLVMSTGYQIQASNQGIEFNESDTNPTCSSGNYSIYADTSEGKLKKCENGVVNNLDVAEVRGASESSTDTLTSTDTVLLSVSITPTTTINEIWITAAVQVNSGSGTDDTATITVIRGSTCGTNVLATRTKLVNLTAATGVGEGNASFTITDAPSTTSATTYSICGKTTANIAHTATNKEITVQEVDTTADLAEIYPSNDNTLASGEVVSIDDELGVGVKRSTGSYDNKVLGVVSTRPALLIGATEGKGNAGGVPLALSGRVPIRISTENGSIKIGDPLAVSSIPGVAMKATKAGTILGMALESYDNDTPGQVMGFVKTGYYNGSNLKEILESTITDQTQLTQNTIGKTALEYFMKQKQTPTSDLNVFEILTDRLAAGLEVITPTVIADTVNTNTIKSSTGNTINLVLDDNGKFIIGKSESVTSEDGTKSISTKSAITFDSLGNATFAGTVTAKEIKVADIAEIQAIADQINQLSEGQEAFTLTADAMNKLSGALAVAQTDIAKLQKDTTDVSVAVNGLIASGADLDTRLKTIEKLLSANAFDALNSVTTATLTVKGGASFEGETRFNGLSFFSQAAVFTARASFGGPIEFTVPPLFNKDTAGYALVKPGGKRVRVAFDQPYVATPVVNTSITFEKDDGVDDAEANKLFTQDIRFVVVDKDATGFTILLNKTVTRDMRFSWNAFSVRDPKIFESIVEGLTIDIPQTTIRSTTDGDEQLPPSTLPPSDANPATNEPPVTDSIDNGTPTPPSATDVSPSTTSEIDSESGPTTQSI